jgi:hypothetical protein
MGRVPLGQADEFVDNRTVLQGSGQPPGAVAAPIWTSGQPRTRDAPAGQPSLAKGSCPRAASRLAERNFDFLGPPPGPNKVGCGGPQPAEFGVLVGGSVALRSVKRPATDTREFLHGPPDLAVEVLSPDDRPGDGRANWRSTSRAVLRSCWWYTPMSGPSPLIGLWRHR